MLQDDQAAEDFRITATQQQQSKKASRRANRKLKKLEKFRNIGTPTETKTSPPLIQVSKRARARAVAQEYQDGVSTAAANSRANNANYTPIGTPKFVPQIDDAGASHDVNMRFGAKEPQLDESMHEQSAAVATDRFTNPERAKFLLHGSGTEVTDEDAFRKLHSTHQGKPF